MFLKNIKYGTRNLLRDKFYFGINLFGLSIGMAAALLILFWVKDELS
jgi:putative ABC transport system permease protein